MTAFSDSFVSLAPMPSATGVLLPTEPSPKCVRMPDDVLIFHIIRSTSSHGSIPVGVEPATFRSSVMHFTSAHVRWSGLQHKVLPFCPFPKCMQQKYQHINSITYSVHTPGCVIISWIFTISFWYVKERTISLTLKISSQYFQCYVIQKAFV